MLRDVIVRSNLEAALYGRILRTLRAWLGEPRLAVGASVCSCGELQRDQLVNDAHLRQLLFQVGEFLEPTALNGVHIHVGIKAAPLLKVLQALVKRYEGSVIGLNVDDKGLMMMCAFGLADDSTGSLTERGVSAARTSAGSSVLVPPSPT